VQAGCKNYTNPGRVLTLFLNFFLYLDMALERYSSCTKHSTMLKDIHSELN